MKVNSFVAIAILLLSCNQDKINKEFYLNGNFSGTLTESLVLSYTDSTETYVSDTIDIVKGKFYTKGFINGATYVSLRGNTKLHGNKEVNTIDFFLEPKKIHITLSENNFKEANITGSLTHEEFENYQQTVKPINDSMNTLMLKRNALMEKKRIDKSNSSFIDDSLKKIYFEWGIKLNDLRDKRLGFATTNPNSHLSAFWVGAFHFRELPLDSAEYYYNSFSTKVKSGIYGKELKLKIEKSRVSTRSGDKAPNFSTYDSNGEEINLDSFKGSYVLLDFWAGWCAPCLKNHPDLKRLYNKYHTKGLEIISVSFDKDENSWKTSINKEGVDIWHHVFAGLGRNHNESIKLKYNIQPIPAYILIDNEGFIVERYLAADNHKLGIKDLEKELEDIFK